MNPLNDDTFFLLWRGIFGNGLWQHVTECRVFLYLLGQARHSKKPSLKYKPVIVQQGQYLRSYRNLIKDLEYIENREIKRYSLSTLKYTLDRLNNLEHRITTKLTEHGTLFTIVNYCKYQLKGIESVNLEQGLNTNIEQGLNNTNKGKKGGKGGGVVNSSSLTNYKSKVNSTILLKKSFADFSNVTEAHEKFIETFIDWVRYKQHPTYWQGWAKECNSEMELYIKTFNNALDIIDKLQRLDGYSTEEIFKATRWGMEDKFWKKQFRSLKKLRKKNEDGVKYIVVFLAKQGESGKGRIDTWLEEVARKGF